MRSSTCSTLTLLFLRPFFLAAMGRRKSSKKTNTPVTGDRTTRSTTGTEARTTCSTAAGQKRSSAKEKVDTVATKRRNTKSSSGSSPRPLTEDDISSIVTAVVQALPGDRDHTSREEEESADSSEVVERSTASRNNPASNDPHDFGELTVLYLSLLYGHT